jgi:hypothetical protein
MSFRGPLFEILSGAENRADGRPIDLFPCKHTEILHAGPDCIGRLNCLGLTFKDWFHTGKSVYFGKRASRFIMNKPPQVALIFGQLWAQHLARDCALHFFTSPMVRLF